MSKKNKSQWKSGDKTSQDEKIMREEIRKTFSDGDTICFVNEDVSYSGFICGMYDYAFGRVTAKILLQPAYLNNIFKDKDYIYKDYVYSDNLKPTSLILIEKTNKKFVLLEEEKENKRLEEEREYKRWRETPTCGCSNYDNSINVKLTIQFEYAVTHTHKRKVLIEKRKKDISEIDYRQLFEANCKLF